MRICQPVFLSALLATIVPTFCVAEETRTYMLLFSAQRSVNRPKYAHTFASFVKVHGPAEKREAEQVTISWVGERFSLFADPVRGKNLGLVETLDRCRRREQRVSVWGPVEITESFYHKALLQAARLERGVIKWQAIDTKARRCGVATNCFHAISDICDQSGLLETGFCCGDAATEKVFKHLKPHMIGSATCPDDVIDLLGLHGYCMHRKDCW